MRYRQTEPDVLNLRPFFGEMVLVKWAGFVHGTSLVVNAQDQATKSPDQPQRGGNKTGIRFNNPIVRVFSTAGRSWEQEMGNGFSSIVGNDLRQFGSQIGMRSYRAQDGITNPPIAETRLVAAFDDPIDVQRQERSIAGKTFDRALRQPRDADR